MIFVRFVPIKISLENNINGVKVNNFMEIEKQSLDKSRLVPRNENYETLKGTSDTLPCEMIRQNEVLDIIREGFEKYGFRPFDTPIVEYFETLAGKYDEDAEIVQEIFKVTDRGSRSLGLRYDLTNPLCRFVASQKQLKKPFRRYQIGKVFRDGPIKVGRLREFFQCDGDVVGEEGVAIEAELLSLYSQTYDKLGIDYIVELNSNKILRGAFLQLGFAEKDLQTLILSVDKLKKIGEEGVLEEIKKKGFDEKKVKDAISILNCKSFVEIEKKAKIDILKEGIEELKELTLLLEGEVEYRVNFSMSRGLAIYSGNIWEVYDKNNKVTSSIGGGGRYDRVIGEYQGSYEIIPAVGVSFGLVPIIACLDNGNSKEGLTDILVVPLEKDLVVKSFKIAKKLRKKQNVEVFYGYKLKKAFSYAEYLGCDRLAIVGKKDLDEGFYTLKNIKTGKEEKFKV